MRAAFSVIIGDVDTAAIRPWIENTGGSWSRSPAPTGMQASSATVVLELLPDGLDLDRKRDYRTRYHAAISAVTAGQVNAAIKRHVKPGSLFKITAGDHTTM